MLRPAGQCSRMSRNWRSCSVAREVRTRGADRAERSAGIAVVFALVAIVETYQLSCRGSTVGLAGEAISARQRIAGLRWSCRLRLAMHVDVDYDPVGPTAQPTHLKNASIP